MADTAAPAPPSQNGPPAELNADARLSRIEQAISVLAERQALAAAPEGYAATPTAQSTAGGGIPISSLVNAAQAAGYLPGGEDDKKKWLNWPVLRETRELFYMYIDTRYRVSTWGKFGVLGLLAGAVLCGFFFNVAFVFPVLSQIFEYLLVGGISIAVYMLLKAELGRYRTVLDYLKKYGR